MMATTGSVEENWWPPVKVKPIFVAAVWMAWNELALCVKGCAKALKFATKLLFELISSAMKGQERSQAGNRPAHVLQAEGRFRAG